ncbi:MAG: hypothetical protein JW840_00410 [Candidatus Thermoplasmatota archaeon]|nr:hypothetical protein [Candidatus Thermoplasmatota archaeon]
METKEPIWDEDKQKRRLLKTSKFFFLITMIYSLWIVLLVMSVYFLQLEYKWAGLTIEQWILSAIVLISLILALYVILLLQYIILKNKHLHPEKQKEHEYIQGKQVYHYTIPLDAKGGIFSKTFILIDEDNVLNLRYQMIPPNDLWGQQQEMS